MSAASPPVDLADPLAILRYGEDALDGAAQLPLQRALDDTAMAALVQHLQQLQLALQAEGRGAGTRKVGLLGRLLGQDVEAEVQARSLRARLGVVLSNADTDAAALAAHVAELPAMRAALDSAIAGITARIEAAQRWLLADTEAGASPSFGSGLSPRQQLQNRLQHLQTAQASWQLAAGQVQLLDVQAQDVLMRWQRIRDVLVPVLRGQMNAATVASSTQLLDASVRAQAEISAEVDAITGKLAGSRKPETQ